MLKLHPLSPYWLITRSWNWILINAGNKSHINSTPPLAVIPDIAADNDNFDNKLSNFAHIICSSTSIKLTGYVVINLIHIYFSYIWLFWFQNQKSTLIKNFVLSHDIFSFNEELSAQPLESRPSVQFYLINKNYS